MNIKKDLIDEEMLDIRIKQLGRQISNDYDGDITLICILKGSMYFIADLSREIKNNTFIEFIRVSSYEGENSTGEIELKVGLDENLTGKDVIIVEDIVDTGYTLSYLIKYLNKQNPKSLKVCTLLDKPDRRKEHDLIVDYVGFSIPNYFVVGYGLDFNQKYRNLKDIECFLESDEDIAEIEKAKKIIKSNL